MSFVIDIEEFFSFGGECNVLSNGEDFALFIKETSDSFEKRLGELLHFCLIRGEENGDFIKNLIN